MPAPGDVPEIEDAVRTPKGGLEEVRARSRAPSTLKLDIGEVGGWVRVMSPTHPCMGER